MGLIEELQARHAEFDRNYSDYDAGERSGITDAITRIKALRDKLRALRDDAARGGIRDPYRVGKVDGINEVLMLIGGEDRQNE